MFKKTVSFFSSAIFSSPSNTIKILLGTALDTLASISNTLVPLLFVTMIDKDEEISPTSYLILGSAIVLARLLPKLRAMLITPVMTDVQKKLTLKMLEKTFSLELDRHISAPTGQFSEALSRNYTTVQSLIPVVFGDLLPFVIDTTVITVALGVKYDVLSAFPPTILAMFLSIAAIAEKQLAKTRNDRSNVYNRAFGMLMQAIGNYSIAHQFGNVNHELKKVEPIMNKAASLNLKTFLISNTVGLFQTLINYLGLAGAFILGVYKYKQGSITTTDLAFISYVMTTFSMRLDTITPALSSLHASYTDAQKIREFSERQSAVADHVNATVLDLHEAPTITFENVTFRYPLPNGGISSPILDGISFTVEAGQMVAIVGETGAGKSTFIQLLLRFYQCGSGKILIDNIDIANVTQASLRDHITIVSQDAGLFNAKVSDNIKYGNLQAKPQEIKKVAYAAEYLKEKDGDVEAEQRLNTDAGEKGQRLSGGEKQRVAISRALLKGGLIFLLDEPTSSLDPQTAESVQNKLNQVSRGATTILVTHKLYELINVNKILYLEKGKIIEEGSFSALLNKDGKFAAQLEAQCNKLNISLGDIRAKMKGKEEENDRDKKTVQVMVDLEYELTVGTNFQRRKQRPQIIIEEHEENKLKQEQRPLLSVNQ